MKVFNTLSNEFEPRAQTRVLDEHELLIFSSIEERDSYLNTLDQKDIPENICVIEIKEIVEGKGKLAVCACGTGQQTHFLRCEGMSDLDIIKIYRSKVEKKSNPISIPKV